MMICIRTRTLSTVRIYHHKSADLSEGKSITQCRYLIKGDYSPSAGYELERQTVSHSNECPRRAVWSTLT